MSATPLRTPGAGGLSITAAAHAEDLAELPWDQPLAEWPVQKLVGLPRGISRHVVRFVEISGAIVAVKETREHLAVREYYMLKDLVRLDVPCVRPLGFVRGRRDPDGNPLDCALLTTHLRFSLPYRALFTRSMDSGTAARLVDALAVLLVRLHLVGFFWGDVSLSNTLFTRDAEAFQAFLVDAETGELHEELTDGQREHDLTLAHTNIAGEFMDLQAGGLIDPHVDPLGVSEQLRERYTELWQEITRTETFSTAERWRVDERVRRLNELGFDVGEIAVTTDIDGVTAHLEPKVVAPGHHVRRLKRLTGVDAKENQARRLLNDLDQYRTSLEYEGLSEEDAAARWKREVFDVVLGAVPADLGGKLEPAQIFHEFLDHRWLRSEAEQRDVPLQEATASYIAEVLRHRRDEASYIRAVDEQDSDTAGFYPPDPQGEHP